MPERLNDAEAILLMVLYTAIRDHLASQGVAELGVDISREIHDGAHGSAGYELPSKRLLMIQTAIIDQPVTNS